MEQLKNEKITIEISSLGAELQSIKDTEGHEYLWQADAKYWGRHSPILFPIVCGLWNGKYRTENKEFAMERHGFARDAKFNLIKKTENKVTYALADSEETLKIYPYNFNLAITYRLEDNKIHVIWHVENTDTKEIYFSIGGHPAFNVPDFKSGEPLTGILRFDNKQYIERIFGNVGGCILPDRFPLKTSDGLWEFTEDSFKDDAVIIDKCQVHEISMLDKEKKPVVTIKFKAPAVGIWSPFGKNAPFVCIEPWYGVHDYVNFTGELKDKYLINKLQPGASFMSEYTIAIK